MYRKGNSPYARIVLHARAQGNLSETEPMHSTTLLYLFIWIFADRHIIEHDTSLHLSMNFSRYWNVYLISIKTEALECFEKYLSLVENQLNFKVKALRTDRGWEYLCEQFKMLCDKKRIVI